jgi:hypothetical protein
MQPRRSAPKEMDNVTATCHSGRVTAILYSLLATRLRSLAIILHIHLFTITRVHVCNRIPIITIRMPMKPNTGVSALTPCPKMSVNRASMIVGLASWKIYPQWKADIPQ